jgi:hypothetical protein
MRRLLVCVILTALPAIAGCQTDMPAQSYQKPCLHRQFDAGFCDQPTNFRLFDYLVHGG